MPRYVILALALLLISLLPAPTAAADVGWCGTPEEMTALLRSEGQRSLIHGNQRVPWNPNNEVGGVIFTADPEGRVGYMLHADKLMGTRAAKMCIADRMHHVKLYDAHAETIPEETLVKSTANAAERRCAQLVQQKIVAEASCGFHNDGLARSSKFVNGSPCRPTVQRSNLMAATGLTTASSP